MYSDAGAMVTTRFVVDSDGYYVAGNKIHSNCNIDGNTTTAAKLILYDLMYVMIIKIRGHAAVLAGTDLSFISWRCSFTCAVS